MLSANGVGGGRLHEWLVEPYRATHPVRASRVLMGIAPEFWKRAW
jgi:hypothetical protein